METDLEELFGGVEPDTEEEVLDEMTDVEDLPPDMGGPDRVEEALQREEEAREEEEVLEEEVLGEETVVEEPVVEEPVVEEPDELQTAVALRATIQELSGLLARYMAEPVAQREEPSEETPLEREVVPKAPAFSTEPISFVDEERFNAIMTDPATLNGFLNEFRLQMIEDFMSVAPTAMLATAGEYVNALMDERAFYESDEGRAVADYKQLLNVVYLPQVDLENPNASHIEKLRIAAKRTSEALALAAMQEDEAPPVMAPVGKGGGRRSPVGDTRTATQRDIDELFTEDYRQA